MNPCFTALDGGFIQERFGQRRRHASERKKDLDQVFIAVASGEQLSGSRLYLQIESGESNFADLAKRYAEGRAQHQRNCGPVSLTRRIRHWLRSYKLLSPASCWNHFDFERWLAGTYAPARSTMRSPTRCAMSYLMFGYAWFRGVRTRWLEVTKPPTATSASLTPALLPTAGALCVPWRL